MILQSSNLRPSNLTDKKVLLIDRGEATREVRTAVLRSRGVEVDTVEDFSSARLLSRIHRYHWIFIDVRGQLPGEALEFYEQIKDASPWVRIVFLVGPPKYLSRTWPREITVGDESHGQWDEMVKRFMAAA